MARPAQPQTRKSEGPKSPIAQKMRPSDPPSSQSQVRASSSSADLGFARFPSDPNKAKVKVKVKMKARKVKTTEKRRRRRRRKEMCQSLERMRAGPAVDGSLEENEKESLLRWVETCLQGERSGEGEGFSPSRREDVPDSLGRSVRNSSNASKARIFSGSASIRSSKPAMDDSLSNGNGIREQAAKHQVSGAGSSLYNAYPLETNIAKEEEEEEDDDDDDDDDDDASSTRENGVSREAQRDCLTWPFHHNGISQSPSISQEEGERRAVTVENENGARGGERYCKKRKREADKVLDYVMKRCIVLRQSPLSGASSSRGMTRKTSVTAWGKHISVTVTTESSVVQRWIQAQNSNVYGLDVEWRPNRIKGVKDNKVALLQLCGENECLIIQMLFLDRKPPELSALLNDPDKSLAGVGVSMDGKRLLNDHGLLCRGTIELTTLAVEKLRRQELGRVGLKVLVQEVLGVEMEKRKSVTMSNWAQRMLNDAQVKYACMDAFVSYALCQRLLSI